MILLSFNITDSEHFLKNKMEIGNEKLIEIVIHNTESILRTLEPHEVPTTFFITSDLVTNFSDLIKNIYKKGHEIALYHTGNWSDTENAQNFVERLIGKSVKGIRINGSYDVKEIIDRNFFYVSPVEKVRISHLFNKLERKTEVYTDEELEVIPQSFAPYSQVPYNETVFQYFPMDYYKNMVFETLKNSEYVLVYLNILQFTDFEYQKFKIPFYKKYNTGKRMEDKLDKFLQWINDNDIAISTMKDFLI